MFENQFASYIGTRYAFGTSMGRTALYVALKAIDIREGDEVIIPGYICEVVPIMILKLKAVPVLSDINLDNYHLSLCHLKSLINDRTKAVVINHIFGYPEDIDNIKNIINFSGKKIFLIEDAAHALGANYNGKKVGNFGDIGIFSFTKNIINLGGGVITTNNQLIAEKIESIIAESNDLSLVFKLFFGLLSLFDLNRIDSRINNLCMNFLEVAPKIINSHHNSYTKSLKVPEDLAMSDIQAAIAIYALKYLDKSNLQRNFNKMKLDLALRNCRKIKLPRFDEKFAESVNTWYIMMIDANINLFICKCKKKRVYISHFWDFSAINKIFPNKNFNEDLPNAKKAYENTIVFRIPPRALDVKRMYKAIKQVSNEGE